LEDVSQISFSFFLGGLTILRNAIDDRQQEILSLLKQGASKPSTSVPLEQEAAGGDEAQLQEILSLFPILDKGSFDAFDVKLKEESYRKQVVCNNKKVQYCFFQNFVGN
jgi:hypothetical protein